MSTLRARICAYAKTAMKTMSMDFRALILTSVLWSLTVARTLLTVPILLVHSLAPAKPDILATELSASMSTSVYRAHVIRWLPVLMIWAHLRARAEVDSLATG